MYEYSLVYTLLRDMKLQMQIVIHDLSQHMKNIEEFHKQLKLTAIPKSTTYLRTSNLTLLDISRYHELEEPCREIQV